MRTEFPISSGLLSMLFVVSTEIRRLLKTRVGLTINQYHILVHLSAGPTGQRGMGELSEQYGLAPSTISSALRGLEHGGAVVRHEDDKDRRVALCGVTDQGRERLRQADGLLIDYINNLWKPLAVATRAGVLQGAIKIVAASGRSRMDGAHLRTDTAYVDSFFIVTDRLAAAIHSSEFTLNQFRVLFLLYERQAVLAASDLVHELLLRPEDVTHATKILEDVGAVERHRGTHDKRHVYFAITDYGFHRTEKVIRKLDRVFLMDPDACGAAQLEAYRAMSTRVMSEYRAGHIP